VCKKIFSLPFEYASLAKEAQNKYSAEKYYNEIMKIYQGTIN
jgi:hypothetical protein